MRRIAWLPVLLGGIVDVGGTSLAGLPIVIYVMMTSPSIVSLPQAEQTAAVMAFIKSHAVLYAILGLIGCLFSVLGGYISARLARRSELLNAALSSCLCLTLGIYSLANGQEQLPLWLSLLVLPLSPILAALGGYVRLRQLRARPGVPSSSAA